MRIAQREVSVGFVRVSGEQVVGEQADADGGV